MPRKRHRSTSADIRFRNMLESSGLPAMAGKSRLGLKATKPITESVATNLGGGVTVENATGTSYTVVAADDGKVLHFTAATLVTVTLPDGLPIGHLTHLLFVGAAGGAVQDNGTSVVNAEGTVDQHKEASCLVVATNTWSVLGT